MLRNRLSSRACACVRAVPYADSQNVNVRAAYLHVLGDCIQSIGVMIAGGLIWWKPQWQIAGTRALYRLGVYMYTSERSFVLRGCDHILVVCV